jgi:hypothetical protein
MAMRQYVFLTIVLVLLILTTGCSDTSAEGPPLPTMNTLPVPGNNPQEILQAFGEVTGQGIPGGTIDIITFTVGLIDSHKSVDMEQLTIFYADAIRTETLRPVEGYHGDPPKGFGASPAWRTKWEALITGSIMKSGSSSVSTQKRPLFPGR